MFIQHMMYVDNAFLRLPCLLYMIVGGKVATAADVEFSACVAISRCKRALHDVQQNAINTVLCVLIKRWGQASEMSSQFSQSLYPGRSLQALFVPARDHISQYLNSCRR